MHNLSEQTAIILKNICIKITYYSFLYIFCACLFSAVSFCDLHGNFYFLVHHKIKNYS